jgi:hypothetical protein
MVTTLMNHELTYFSVHFYTMFEILSFLCSAFYLPLYQHNNTQVNLMAVKKKKNNK